MAAKTTAPRPTLRRREADFINGTKPKPKPKAKPKAKPKPKAQAKPKAKGPSQAQTKGRGKGSLQTKAEKESEERVQKKFFLPKPVSKGIKMMAAALEREQSEIAAEVLEAHLLAHGFYPSDS